jgi:hypothetical protein
MKKISVPVTPGGTPATLHVNGFKTRPVLIDPAFLKQIEDSK